MSFLLQQRRAGALRPRRLRQSLLPSSRLLIAPISKTATSCLDTLPGVVGSPAQEQFVRSSPAVATDSLVPSLAVSTILKSRTRLCATLQLRPGEHSRQGGRHPRAKRSRPDSTFPCLTTPQAVCPDQASSTVFPCLRRRWTPGERPGATPAARKAPPAARAARSIDVVVRTAGPSRSRTNEEERDHRDTSG